MSQDVASHPKVMEDAANVKAGEARAESATAGAHEEVQRWDLHQRFQHGLMASSFIVLVLTGWPLSAARVGSSSGLVAVFGGLENLGLWHRIGAIVMVIASLYHLAYLGLLVKRGQFKPSMVPRWKDAKDLAGNLLFFVGIRKERPRFPRYTYFEKFDYWAVFWGMVIMAGSGFVRWFPEQAARFLPMWGYEIAYFAHTDEAVLALLAIFVWHFYNVHLRPAAFPMSWVFLTGKMSLEEIEEDHGEEYEEIMARRAASSRSEEASPPPGPESDEPSASTDTRDDAA